MSLRWPDLELLRRKGGDLIALSPLSQDSARRAMIEALRRLEPALAAQRDGGPDVAIVEALAACVEVMGFYHDRFLTESKLGSAQLLDDLGKIVALVGYRPLPSVAATGFQFFEAIAAGRVDAGTRVAGKTLVPPATIAFETDAGIDVSPALNRMALSPLITRSAAAVRAVLAPLRPGTPPASSQITDAIARHQQARGPALPTDDLRPETTAMVADAQGLELVPVGGSRSRGVAFARPLGRSFDPSSALVSRTTVIRQLRGPRALSDELVAFEVSEAPILHRPSAAAPELLISSLELFVLRPGDEALDPSEWDPALRYAEVFDFSASEVSDLHYRTFVDDALHTWVILRRTLGAHELLEQDQLERVYARFIPAIGAVIDPPEPSDGAPASPVLTGVTLGLEPGYFNTSLVLPSVANTPLAARATWAMVDRDLGLLPGDSILIQDASGRRWVRTLIDPSALPFGSAAGRVQAPAVELAPGASPRLLRWAADPPAVIATDGLPEAHEPVDGVLDPATARIGSLTDAARGEVFPTWSELYAQLQAPGAYDRAPAADLPIAPSSPAGVIERQRVVAPGTTHLVLRDASHVAAGDYLLLGNRLTAAFRAPRPFGYWRWKPSEPPFDPRTPWLDAEVVQAQEVRGNVVRLATPVSQTYFVHRGRTAPAADPTALSEVIVVPGVVSVASGDQLRQTLSLSTQPVYRGLDEQLHDASYVLGMLDRSDYLAGALRRPLAPTTPGATAADLWKSLFVAVAGVAEAQIDPAWTLAVVVRICNLRAPAAQIVRLELDTGERVTADGIAEQLAREAAISVLPATGPRIADDAAAIAVLATPPVWRRVSRAPGAGELRVVDATSFDVIPAPPARASEPLLGDGGTLILIQPGAELALPFTWDAIAGAPRVQGIAPRVPEPFEALLVSHSQTADLDDEATAAVGIDWRVPAARFAPALPDRRDCLLVGASASGEIVLDVAFAHVEGEVALVDVPDRSADDPLRDAATAWTVLPGELRVAAADVEARWRYELAEDQAALPPSAAIRLALLGEQRALVAAETSADGRSVVVDAEDSRRAGDLGFALDQLCVLEGEPVAGGAIAASTIWTWQAIDPPLFDLPEPADAQIIAVVARHDGSLATIAWPRADVWWDPARRTLRLPTAPLDAHHARPEQAVRLLQVLAPSIDLRTIAIQYDAATDRSIATLWLPAGWPSSGLVPAPVVVAAPGDGPPEVRDLVSPVDVFTDPRGRVRWTMHFAGDVRTRWRSLAVAVRDWPAPVERGLTVAALWRVPAHERAPEGPVSLIVSLGDCAGFVAVTAMARRVGDALELTPFGRDDAFPPVASVASIDVATRAITAAAGASIALRGTTLLALDAGAPGDATDVVFEEGFAWQPIHVERTAIQADGRRSYELDRAYLSVFPDGIAAEQHVRLCIARSTVDAGAPRATPRTLRLRLSRPDSGGGLAANAAVFHRDDLADRVVLDTIGPPTLAGETLTLELAVNGALGALFGAQANRHRVGLAQRWGTEIAKQLVRQPLRVELGDSSPYAIATGDVVHLGFHDDAPVSAVVRGVDGRNQLDLASTTLPALPDELRLHGLRTPIAPDDCAATLEVTPSSPQPPWLLSFDNEPSPSSLVATLLPYAATTVVDATTTRRRFEFRNHAKLVEIFRRTGDALYLLTNERDELRADFYTRTDDAVGRDLAPATPNFLDAPAETNIDRLVLTSSAWAGKAFASGEPPRPIVLASTSWAPTATAPLDQLPELRIQATARGRIATHVVLQSTRFNSGNFIPVAGQGASPAAAAATIASALRVSALPVDRDGNPVPGQTWRPMTFVPLEELGTTSATLTRDAAPGTLAAFEGMTYREAVLTGALEDATKYVFSAAFSAAGACTLHFLIIDEALRETVRVRIEAQYEVNPGRAGDGLGDPVYALETPVAPLDPATRLALLAPGSLKPGALLFVRMPSPAALPNGRAVQATGDVPALQWTRVTRVTGALVDVAPALRYAPEAGLEPIEVTALGPLASAAQLDADYYASAAKAKLVPGGPLVLPLRDRLALDVVGDGGSLVRALIPGDLVLVIDERLRRAWALRRRDEAAGNGADWRDWPDFQHQAVIKRIDADSGLVVLAAPLPDRFQIRWQLDAEANRLTASPEDIAALRVLPHYRAPVQGRRSITVLGSGDSTRRFARFVSSLEATTGSAVLPLDRDGVSTGNLEVLAFDPAQGAWSRWLRHDDLARAGKKDPAFVLGFRPGDPRGIPVSVTFGDGLTGQLLPTGTDNVILRATRIGAAETWLARPRRVAIVERQIAAGPVVPLEPAPPTNLKLRLACAAPSELAGAGDANPRWRPALELVVTLPDATTRAFHEITEDEAARGAHGFLRVSSLDMPPGVVDAYLYAPIALPERSTVVAWQIPGTRQWALDQEFYRDLPDLTDQPGATALQLLSTTGLRAGSRLALFATPDGAPDIVRLASVDPPTWSAVLEQPLARAYDLARSVIRGNIAPIVQGAVDRTKIGSSDGTTASLRLPLSNRAPLLYVVKPGRAPEPDVQVLVADQAWTRVVDFATTTPSDRVWRLDVDPDGAAAVVFGDGRHGAIPPAGRDHIEAIVRLGSGAAGNLPAGAVNKLVTGNLAVRATANLIATAGGSAGDTPASARENAFAHRLPGDRVVSAIDCVRAAIGDNDVIAAALDPTAPGDELRLVIALAHRRSATPADLAAVHDRVAGAMPLTAHTRLTVVAAAQAAVHLVVELGVDAAALPADVFAAVATAFGAGRDGLFAAERWEIGEPLRLGDVYDAIFQVHGVAHARVLWMAGAPLPEGEQPRAPAPDVFDPGSTGVVRCDNDPIADPFGRRGTFRLQQVEP